MPALPMPRCGNASPTLAICPLTMSVTEFGKLASDESEKWATVIRTANIKAE